MSGRKQHYIPQLFLRGFLICQQSGQTHVYRRDKMFISKTDSVAAQRDFYSKPANDANKTLDDKLTDYEGRLGELLRILREKNVGTDVEASIAAEVIAHLTPRSKSLRSIFGHGTQKLISGLADVISDKTLMISLLGLDEPTTNKKWSEHIASSFNRNPEIAKSLGGVSEEIGIPKDSIERMLFMSAKESFLGDANPFYFQLQPLFTQLLTGIEDAISYGHKKVLNNGVVVEARKQSLESLLWRIFPAPQEGAIMPDCIAIGFDEEEGVYLPYIMASSISTVIMPLTSEKLLVGVRASNINVDLSGFNDDASECSDELFIAASSAHEYLRKNIGGRWKNRMDNLVHDTLDTLCEHKAYDNLNVAESISCPSFSYQITFNDGLSDDIENINEIVQGVVAKLSQWLDLSRLDGITYASNCEKALEDIERGFDGNETPESEADYLAQGGAALLVKRNGIIKVRIVFHQDYAHALAGEDLQNREVAIHLLFSSLFIVHTINHFEYVLPEFLLEPVMMNNHPAVMHCAMRKALRAYYYAFASAEFGAEGLLEQEFSHYVIRALDSNFFKIVSAKEEHKIDNNHSKLFRTVHAAVADILIAMARLIGHLQGISKSPLLNSDTDVGAAIAARELAGWVDVFAHDLERFWKQPSWTREDLYALNVHVERLLWPHGIFLFSSDNEQGTMILSV